MLRLRGIGPSQKRLIFVSLFVCLHHKTRMKNGARCRFRTCKYTSNIREFRL